MQLYLNLKIFFRFFAAFLKSKLNFEHFEKHGESQSWCIYEIIYIKKRGYLNA